jgi:nucleoside-diphosphate-sugar epimerase
VHRLDAARVYRLALEKAPAGSRLHAVADEGVALREIATVIGRQLNLPVISVRSEQAGEHFGALARFVALDCPASSALTQQLLGWRPAQPGLIEDLEHPHYFASVPTPAR